MSECGQQAKLLKYDDDVKGTTSTSNDEINQVNVTQKLPIKPKIEMLAYDDLEKQDEISPSFNVIPSPEVLEESKDGNESHSTKSEQSTSSKKSVSIPQPPF